MTHRKTRSLGCNISKSFMWKIRIELKCVDNFHLIVRTFFTYKYIYYGYAPRGPGNPAFLWYTQKDIALLSPVSANLFSSIVKTKTVE